MELCINGEVTLVPDTVTDIAELIIYFDLGNRVVMIEHNENILDKNTHAGTSIQDGDKIEIVQFVGGG